MFLGLYFIALPVPVCAGLVIAAERVVASLRQSRKVMRAFDWLFAGLMAAFASSSSCHATSEGASGWRQAGLAAGDPPILQSSRERGRNCCKACPARLPVKVADELVTAVPERERSRPAGRGSWQVYINRDVRESLAEITVLTSSIRWRKVLLIRSDAIAAFMERSARRVYRNGRVRFRVSRTEPEREP
jgi:hypothetical protein